MVSRILKLPPPDDEVEGRRERMKNGRKEGSFRAAISGN
jgi:hypothetical protein